jgi:hypothetical protein
MQCLTAVQGWRVVSGFQWSEGEHHIKDGGSVVGTAGTRGRFRGCVILADDTLRFLPEFEAAALSPVFCSAREAI